MRRVVFGWISVAALAAGAASISDNWQTWHIDSLPMDPMFAGANDQVRYLVFDGNHYHLRESGRLTDPSVERISINEQNRSIKLMTSTVQSATTPSVQEYQNRCAGEVGPKRRTSFYSLCNSRFAWQLKGEHFGVDSIQLQAALDDAGFLKSLPAYRLFAYRQAFAHANTPDDLERFITRYQGNDAEALVPAARQRLAAILPRFYLSDFFEAMNLQLAPLRKVALETYVRRYKGDDPDGLVVQANAELRKLAANPQGF